MQCGTDCAMNTVITKNAYSCTYTNLSELEGFAVATDHGDHGQHEGLAGIVSISRRLLLQYMFQLCNDLAGHVA